MNTEEILSRLVSINSVFPNESRLASFVATYLRKSGFKVTLQKIENGRYNLLAERGTEGKTLLFYAHLDTVPIYGNWNTDPLRLARKGDKLYGVGSCDMKGGMAAILESMKTQANRRIKLLFCSDEENISKGIWSAVKNNKKWFNNVFFALSGEPGDSSRHTGGANVVTLGRRGRTVISLDIKGVSSHGALPQKGVNAINEAAKIVSHLKRFELRRHRRLGKESIFIRKIDSSASSLSVPDNAHLEMDLHLVPPGTTKDALARANAFVQRLYQENILNQQTKVSVKIKERETPYIEPYVNDLRNRTVRKVLRCVENTIGEPFFNYGSSVADDNVLFNSLGIPVLTIGPQGGNEHSANEWVSSKSLRQLTQLYETLIEKL